MMSTPPFSSSLAVKPSPAPPTTIGRPSARVRRSRTLTSSRVYLFATSIPPWSERDRVRAVVMAPLLPGAGEHLLEQLGHQVGELGLVHVSVHQQDVEVRPGPVDRAAKRLDEVPGPERPTGMVGVVPPGGPRSRPRPAERRIGCREVDRTPAPHRDTQGGRTGGPVQLLGHGPA